MKKQEYVAALRELADYIEARPFPEVKKSNWSETRTDIFDPPSMQFWLYDKADFGKVCAAMGTFEKQRSDWSTGAEHKLPSGATVGASIQRDQVCKRIVVGHRTVAAEPERVIEARPERTEEIVEWECPDSFVALAKEEPPKQDPVAPASADEDEVPF